jgi:serine/threonine protein kinase
VKEPMPEMEIQAIIRESIRGLEYLHGLRIVHRDIKAANILLCSDGRCKLGTFFLFFIFAFYSCRSLIVDIFFYPADFGVAALLAKNPIGA